MVWWKEIGFLKSHEPGFSSHLLLTVRKSLNIYTKQNFLYIKEDINILLTRML